MSDQAVNAEEAVNKARAETEQVMPRWLLWTVTVIGVAMSAFHIYALGFTVLDPWILTSIHLGFATVLALLWVPAVDRKIAWHPLVILLNFLLAFAAIGAYGYIIYEFRDLLGRAGYFPEPLDIVFGLIAIVLTIEITRRTTGWSLPLIAISALLYALFGDMIPGMFGHRGYSPERLISFSFSMDGLFSTPIQVSARYIFLFILFGAFLQISGAGEFFLRLASAAVGTVRGGPAKIAVFASALFGTISGSAVANTAATGAITIPMMKRIGYRPHFAGAVEAVASTGGQIMPPIMGAGVFIIADIVGVSYWYVAVAAIIPALLYFTTVLFGIDMEAARTGLKGIPRSELPKTSKVLLEGGHLLIPIFVLLFCLAVLLTSPIRAALMSIATMLVVSWLRKHTRMDLRKTIKAFSTGARLSLEVIAACACAGLVVGVLNLTGLGHSIASAVIALSGGVVLYGLLLSMVVCIILGMGLPTTAAYIVAASVVAPALVQLDIAPLAAHLFIFYFACVAVITPPVALASFTAASIAGARPMKVGMTGLKLGIAAFIIPYMFVFNPALIGEASTERVILATATALLGVWGLAGSVQAWFLGPANILLRALLLFGALSLIQPGLNTDWIGFAVLLAVIAWQFVIMRPRRKLAAAEQDKAAANVDTTAQGGMEAKQTPGQ